MSSVYYPAQVVVLFRRFVNAISIFSLSSSQFTKQHANASGNSKPDLSTILETQTTTDDVKGDRSRFLEWPWWIFKESWDWSWLTQTHRTINYSSSLISASLEAGRVQRPWLPSVSLSSGQMLSLTEDLNPGPPPSSSSASSSSSHPPPNDNDESKEPRQSLPEKEEDSRPKTQPKSKELNTIHKLLQNPALLEPIRVPRNPIVLCHGLYGFDTRGPSSFPSLQIHYWSNVLSILRDKMKAEVIVTAVPGTGSIITRAETLDRQLQERAPGRGLNFLAHSMGGLDCRHLISHVKPTKYTPLSLTTVSTPHRGSPFMDWCSENLGLGKLAREEKELLAKASGSSPKTRTRSSLSLASLPSSFTTLLLSILDSPAYANLTSAHLNNVFNPSTPDDPRVKYFSVTGRMPGAGVGIWHPLWLPKMVLDDFEEKERKKLKAGWEEDPSLVEPQPIWARDEEWGNDCLVTVQSSKWGEFLGVMEGCDHWEIRGARGLEFAVDLPTLALPAKLSIPSIPISNIIPSIPGISNKFSLPMGLGGSGTMGTTKRTTGTTGSTPGKDGAGGTGNGTGIGIDLGWFLKAKRKAGDVQEETVTRLPQNQNHVKARQADVNDGIPPTETLNATAGTGAGTRQKEREIQREKDDAVVKASTDKLSAVFNWVSLEANPVLRSTGSDKADSESQSNGILGQGRISPSGSQNTNGNMKKSKNIRRNDLESQGDLERFYIALSRKLYDEGL